MSEENSQSFTPNAAAAQSSSVATKSGTAATMIATLGGLLFGYDTAVISGTISALEYNYVSVYAEQSDLANLWLGFIVSSALIGCAIGGFLAGYISNRFGRKRSLWVAASLFLVSAVGSAFPELLFGGAHSNTSWLALSFVFFRIVGGIGVGLASMLSPLYISEISPMQDRGRFVSYNQMAIVVGMVTVFFVNWSIAILGDEQWLFAYGWRYMFLSEAIPAGCFFALIFMLPESPRWLVSQNRIDEAEQVLNRLGQGEHSQSIIQDIHRSFQHHSQKVLSFGIGLVLIGAALSLFQQLVGINSILYYAPEIFKNMGISTNVSMLNTVLVGIVNVIFTTIAILYVDKWGRRPLMMAGALVMAFAMILLGSLFYFQSLGVIALIAMMIFIAGFALSWGPVTWVLLSELFPNSVRSHIMAIAVATQWIANMLVSTTFPIIDKNLWLVEHFNHGFAYWLYGAFALLAFAFTYKFIPETKGKSLEEIEHFWQAKKTNTQSNIPLQSADHV